MDTYGMNIDWNTGQLARVDIRIFLAEEAKAEGYEITDKELEHITTMCYHIYEWERFNNPLGHFLTAVVKNDLTEAMARADETNRKYLYLICVFLYNVAPATYRAKARGQK